MLFTKDVVVSLSHSKLNYEQPGPTKTCCGESSTIDLLVTQRVVEILTKTSHSNPSARTSGPANNARKGAYEGLWSRMAIELEGSRRLLF